MREIVCGVLVIGGGAAGTRAAIAAAQAGAKKTMVLKSTPGHSGSTCFSGPGSAYQAADGCSHADGDSPELHYRDIMDAALGLADPVLAKILAYEAPERLRELIAWGFVPDPEPCGHDRPHWAGYSCFASKPRAHGILDVSAGHAGALVMAAMPQIERLGVQVLEGFFICDLLVQDDQCLGAVGLDANGEQVLLRSGAVVLGSGGAGQLFPAATASVEATGDGYAQALRAGAELVNMEFMQFMARGLPKSGPVHWMLCPVLRNAEGEAVLERYLPAGVAEEEVFAARTLHYPYSTRDASGWLDIAMRSEALAGRGEGRHGALILDYDHPRCRSRAQAGARPRPQHHWPGPEGPIPLPEKPGKVTHAAHAINGGVYISPDGESSIAGIYAAGETAAGAHGADRLGGNMLPNCQVFGRRAGAHGAARAAQGGPELRGETIEAATERLARARKQEGSLRAKDVKLELQQLNAETLYVVRSEQRLNHLLSEIERLRREALLQIDTSTRRGLCGALEVENMLLVAESMGRAALLRKESRGGHYRDDYPVRDDDSWRQCVFQRWQGGQLQLRTAPMREEI